MYLSTLPCVHLLDGLSFFIWVSIKNDTNNDTNILFGFKGIA
ncbi:hypothetical protein AO385_1250 [Moraxella catarrhalis]|uniref:Uncharacterized protein n=1 Tax=Moraxella catarrhalis TaxID=480 RepID=A0A198UQ33_MORCA|nr:hypothetical protein AO383_1177 [Moraxella catarrhalis]OAU98435.1 hypothetical protein AO384_0019 [Moraxella catarrhalis]OAV00181.1 hypothetical protein AO385_1250 [Moraxella catarrhalis]